jgi:hypothetical protein
MKSPREIINASLPTSGKPIYIPSIEEMATLLDIFISAVPVSDPDYSQLIDIKRKLYAIHKREKEVDSFAQSLSQQLRKWIEMPHFSHIRKQELTFSDVLYQTSLVLATICPINTDDPITLSPIAPSQKVWISDRYCFDVETLPGLLENGRNGALENPCTRTMFSQRDLDNLVTHIAYFKEHKKQLLKEGIDSLTRANLAQKAYINILHNHPLHAPALANSFIFLKQASIPISNHLDLLNTHPQYSLELVQSIICLHEADLLKTSNYRRLQEHPESALSLAQSLQYLKEEKILNQDNYHILEENPQEMLPLAKSFSDLEKAHIFIPATRDILKEFPQYTADLVKLIKSAPIFYVQRGLQHLERAKLLIPEYADMLFRHPEGAVSIAQGLICLKNSEILTPEYVGKLEAHPGHAFTLAKGFADLNKADQLTPANVFTLTEHPSKAASIVKELAPQKISHQAAIAPRTNRFNPGLRFFIPYFTNSHNESSQTLTSTKKPFFQR